MIADALTVYGVEYEQNRIITDLYTEKSEQSLNSPITGKAITKLAEET